MKQVLLVDDSPVQLRVRETVLRNAGLEVSTAADVDSALALMNTSGDTIGVVVTDHLLPGRSGADLVRELRALKYTLPIIVVSGMPQIEDEYEGLSAEFCMKPLPPEQLIAAVRKALA